MTEIHIIKKFQRVLISRTAANLKHGAEIVRLAGETSVPVKEFADDATVVQHCEAELPSTLQILSIPTTGWIAKADFGLLASRTNEYYLHPIVGCRFGCTYCYLLAMPHGRRPLRLYVATDDLLKSIDHKLKERSAGERTLFCTGELADSLAELDIYPVAAVLTEFFAHRTDARLELRTKSENVDRLLPLDHKGNTTVAFSIAPQENITEYEPGTASLSQRIQSARKCQLAEYPVAFKFEPLILTPNWRELYQETFRFIAANVDVTRIEHVSVGCLRWSKGLSEMSVFAKRHGSTVECGTWIEYGPSQFNGTVRRSDRLFAYELMRQMLREHGIVAPIWWSLEEGDLIAELKRRDLEMARAVSTP